MAKSKQLPIPGTERQKIAALSDAAETYVDVRDQRMELTLGEADKQADLVRLMREHKLDSYVDEDLGLTVLLESKTRAKVKKDQEAEA